MSAQARLKSGLAEMGLGLDAATQSRLVSYLRLLDKWNKVHNLTAIRDTAQMVVLHLLDSLSVLPYLEGTRTMLDVGSGAGLPGIPLAVARPELLMTVLDSNHKKAAFLTQAKAELGLDNVTVACARVERWRPDLVFDCVISRAFAELSDYIQLAGHLIAPGGAMLAMKGLHPAEEIARVPLTHRVERVIELHVPTLDAQRHLVFVKAA
jgi:16S rRNA (guanine527-N7)-methyltransferase